MKITITVNVPDDLADPGDSTGLTSDAHDDLTQTLIEQGYDDVEIRRVL